MIPIVTVSLVFFPFLHFRRGSRIECIFFLVKETVCFFHFLFREGEDSVPGVNCKRTDENGKDCFRSIQQSREKARPVSVQSWRRFSSVFPCSSGPASYSGYIAVIFRESHSIISLSSAGVFFCFLFTVRPSFPFSRARGRSHSEVPRQQRDDTLY